MLFPNLTIFLDFEILAFVRLLRPTSSRPCQGPLMTILMFCKPQGCHKTKNCDFMKDGNSELLILFPKFLRFEELRHHPLFYLCTLILCRR